MDYTIILMVMIMFLQSVLLTTSMMWNGKKCPKNSWRLKNLILRDHGLRFVPPSLPECFPNAEYVDLSQNNITYFSPNEFRNMTRLGTLDLSNNPLENICLRHNNIKHLMLTDIARQNKIIVPDCLDLPQLIIIDIQFSNIQLVFSKLLSMMPENTKAHGLMLLPNLLYVLLSVVLVMII